MVLTVSFLLFSRFIVFPYYHFYDGIRYMTAGACPRPTLLI